MNKANPKEELYLLQLLENLNALERRKLACVKVYELLLSKDKAARMEAKLAFPYSQERMFDLILYAAEGRAHVVRFLKYAQFLKTSHTCAQEFEEDYRPLDSAVCMTLRELMLEELEMVKKADAKFLPETYAQTKKHIEQASQNHRS